MTRLPVVGSDNNTWATILDNFLQVGHNATGTLTGIPNVYNVKDDLYAAVGDGSHDDTANIQSAITACQSAGGGIVFLPAGTYNITNTLSITADNITLLGSGWKTILQVGFGWTATNPLIWYKAPVSDFRRGCKLADFSINGQTFTVNNVIQLDSVRHCDVNHIEIHHCPGTHLFMNGSGGFFGAYNTIRACTFRDCYSGVGVLFTDSEWCTIEACQFVLFNLGGAIAIHNLGGLNCNIVGNQFDAVDTGVYLDFCNYTNVTGNQFDEGNTQFIKLKAAQCNTITGNTFNQRTGSGTNMITVDLFGNNQQNVVTGNSAQSGNGWTNFVNEVNTGSGNGGAGNTYANNDTGGASMALTTGRASNNRGFQPQGAASITVGASPYTYTAGPTPETVYISGGTVSAVAKNSITLFATTNCNVDLQPYESAVVTYSVAPTMNKDRH